MINAGGFLTKDVILGWDLAEVADVFLTGIIPCMWLFKTYFPMLLRLIAWHCLHHPSLGDFSIGLSQEANIGNRFLSVHDGLNSLFMMPLYPG